MADVRRESPTVEPGTRIGPFRTERVLGRGYMGVVYVARDAAGARVALKVLDAALAQDPAYRRRFEREGEIAAALDHPGLLPVIARGEVDGTPFLASPYVPGGALSDRLAGGPLAFDRVARIVAGLGGALDELHRRGLVHRDVKPSNVVLAEDGAPLLTDFGVARGAAHTVLTAQGRVVGTVDYLAPEVIRGERAGPPADVYALGCLAFECALGRPPFAHLRSIGEICVAHLREPPPDPAALRHETPRAFADALLTALAKEPAERPRTGAAYARLLRVAARGA